MELFRVLTQSFASLFSTICEIRLYKFLFFSHWQIRGQEAADEGDGGLGDDFRPSVKASCSGGTMTVRVDTEEPYRGVIHGRNRSLCSRIGDGGRKTRFSISLDAADNGCGVTYREVINSLCN